MSVDVRFAFVCRRKWQELSGNDPVQRFCDECHRDIFNLDPLTESEREELFREALRRGEKLCVFATVPVDEANRCEGEVQLGDLPDFAELGGEPVMDDYDTPDDETPDDEDEIKIEL